MCPFTVTVMERKKWEVCVWGAGMYVCAGVYFVYMDCICGCVWV